MRVSMELRPSLLCSHHHDTQRCQKQMWLCVASIASSRAVDRCLLHTEDDTIVVLCIAHDR